MRESVGGAAILPVVQARFLASDSGQGPGQDSRDRGPGLAEVRVGLRLYLDLTRKDVLANKSMQIRDQPTPTPKNCIVKPTSSDCRKKSFAAARV